MFQLNKLPLKKITYLLLLFIYYYYSFFAAKAAQAEYTNEKIVYIIQQRLNSLILCCKLYSGVINSTYNYTD